MLQPNRSFSAGDYRYGFNGQEKSDEVKGEGNSYTAEFWEYDPKIVRRWNVDPRPNPSLSVYSAFAGNPICFVDPLGDTTFLFDKQGHHIENINDNLPNQVHYLSKAQQVRYKIQKYLNKDKTSLALYTRSISTAFISENTIVLMKQIAKEGGNNDEVGFVGIITSTREIQLKSLGTKYSTRTSGGWIYNMDQALTDYFAANPNSNVFLTGHYHPWAEGREAKGQNDDGIKRSGDWFKFFDQEPTKTDDVDYRPYLKNPWNFAIWEEEGNVHVDLNRTLKGPHPLLVITSFGYITYYSGQNKVIADWLPEKLDHNSVKHVEYNSTYFHKY